MIRDSIVRISGTVEERNGVTACLGLWGHSVAPPSPHTLTRVVDVLVPAPFPPRRVPRLLAGLQVLVGCREEKARTPNPP